MFFKNSEKFVTDGISYENIEKKLGKAAKLGVSFYVLDEEGKTIKEGGYKSDTKLLMASSKKVFIALAILEKIYNKKEISLSTVVSVQNSDFSPGRPDNPLDQHFFNSEEITESKTIDSLLTDMLTKSDNTATDVLIKVAGGVEAVNDFIASLGIKDHKLSMTSKKLISDYFKIPVEKSHENIQKAKTTFGIAYTMQDTEETMLTSQEDCCSPKALSELLKLLINEKAKKSSWLHEAADTLFSKMEKCQTGSTLIEKSAREFSNLTQLGSKQGRLGGIRNDTAFMKFDSYWVVLSIFTCCSDLPLTKKQNDSAVLPNSDDIIANLAKNILLQHCDFVKIPQASFEK